MSRITQPINSWRTRLTLISSTLIVLAALTPSRVVAQHNSDQPQVSELLGGRFVNLSQSPVALVLDSKGSICTGVLVASNRVLTAAHCLDDPSTTFVYLDQVIYEVGSATYASGYNPALSLLENVKYDIGLLTLKNTINRIQPVPILEGKPLQTGQNVTVYGYGQNEAWYPVETVEQLFGMVSRNAKQGSLTIDRVFSGFFETSFRSSNVATCGGDSGGPVTMIIQNQEVLVGLVSYGPAGCVSNDLANSGYVDLQSPEAQAFLASYPTLTRYRYVEPTPQPSNTPAVTQPTIFPSGDSVNFSTVRNIFRELTKLRRLAKRNPGLAQDRLYSLLEKTLTLAESVEPNSLKSGYLELTAQELEKALLAREQMLRRHLNRAARFLSKARLL